MNVLITGSTGLLGTEMLKVLSQRYQCRGVGGRIDFPVTEKKKTEEIITYEKPDVIVHLAGCKDLAFCDENPKEAFRVNAIGTRDVAYAAAKIGAQLVYISSDFVFSGKKGEGYYEFDCPDPASVYGWSKWWGEYYITNILEDYYIIRVPFLFGLNGSGRDDIISRALKRAEAGEKIHIDLNMVTNPTWATHVAGVVSDLISTSKFGTYHVGSTGFATIPQFLSAVLKEWGFDPGLVCHNNACDNHHTNDKEITRHPSYNVIQSAALPYIPEVRALPGWREALEECFATSI